VWVGLLVLWVLVLVLVLVRVLLQCAGLEAQLRRRHFLRHARTLFGEGVLLHVAVEHVMGRRWYRVATCGRRRSINRGPG